MDDINPFEPALNVLGEPLKSCSTAPMTGYFRDGLCRTCAQDVGLHTVCAVMTDEFLAFSRSQGNDLSTPMPHFRFPGLKAGDRWCLCAGRWAEAHRAGCAPRVHLQGTHSRTLEVVELADLKAYAIDLS